MCFWYICDGEVEDYNGQLPNWDNELVVQADTPEDALIKALRYYRKELTCREFCKDGSTFLAIS